MLYLRIPAFCLVVTLFHSASTPPLFAQQASGAFFFADPYATRTLAPWDHIQIGASSYKVSDFPEGRTDAGSITLASDPLGKEGSVYKLSVTSEAQFQAGTNLPAAELSKHLSDRVDLWNTPKPYMGQEGQETWEHFRILFRPSGEDAYRPSPGSWNWLVQHHNDPLYKAFISSGAIKSELPELAWGVDTKAKVPDGSQSPQLFMRLRGGDDVHQPRDTNAFVGSPLLFDHWYDMLVHVIWSSDPQKGLVEWWLDGQSVYSQHIADLWRRPDGTTDHVNFEYSNYRLHAEENSTIYFSRVKLGPSRDSVSF